MKQEILGSQKEIRENEPLRGRTILITGGTSGTGEKTALELHNLGAQVLIGTRTAENFQKTANKLGNENVYPFIADLLDNPSVIRAVVGLREKNILPTDIVHSAAGGMEDLLKPVALQLARLQRIEDPEEKEQKLTQIRETVSQKVEESMDAARKVNFEGPKALFNLLYDFLPIKKIICFSSLWSSVYGQEGVEVPGFYRGIASTKSRFEKWLIENAGRFSQKGIKIAIISGHLITDTNVGRGLERFILPLCSPQDRQTMSESFITTNDMVQATVGVLLSDPKDWKEHPLRLFVTGKGVSTTLSPTDQILKVKLPI